MDLSSKLSFTDLFLLLLLLCVLGIIAYAQDSPQDYVNAHNAARSEVGVPDIAWDDTVAAFAQDYANQRKGDCQLVHSGGGRKYGENLAWSTGKLTGTDAVKMWVDEKANYDYDTNSCIDGSVCLHYTQVVWASSIRLGCAKVLCDNGGTFIACNYDPPGNYVGLRPFERNQLGIFCLLPSSDTKIIIRETKK